MELKEGMYVRYTRKMVNEYVAPRIAKIVDCSDDKLVKIDNGQVILRSDIIDKPSFNLIDLIKVGDYVNGYKIEKIQAGENYCYLLEDDDPWTLIAGYDCDGLTIPIKSIVTKEQFEAMKYVVERDK